jgi:hypothetical protein
MKPFDMSLASVKHACVPVFILSLSVLICAVSACSSQKSRPESLPLFLFEERPIQMNCTDRPGPPLPPGRYMVFIGPQAPYARTRLETLNLPLKDFPALTLAAEPDDNMIRISGANQDHWSMQFCAEGEGNTVDEANSYLQKVSMQRTGSLVTLNKTDARGLTGGKGNLLLIAPAGAPVTVHSDGAAEVHDMAGPVRILAARGRASILNTSGFVDASAMVIDFAGSQGTVSLNASWDVNIKPTSQQFHGNLNASALRDVNAFLPPGFQTSIRIYVNRPKDFVCRADICPKMKQDRENSLYRYTYGDVANRPALITLRSENAQVTLDTTP